jgi:hypothetical protein
VVEIHQDAIEAVILQHLRQYIIPLPLPCRQGTAFAVIWVGCSKMRRGLTNNK